MRVRVGSGGLADDYVIKLFIEYKLYVSEIFNFFLNSDFQAKKIKTDQSSRNYDQNYALV